MMLLRAMLAARALHMSDQNPQHHVTDAGIDLHRRPGFIDMDEHRRRVRAAEVDPFYIPDDPFWIPDRRGLTLKKLLGIVAAHYGLSLKQMLSHRREAKLVRARHVAMYFSKKLTARSLPEIGRAMDGLDHTTVLHGYRKIEHLITIDPDLAAEVVAIERKVAEVAE